MYARITVSGSGTEKQFLDAFTSSIVSANAGITCTDDYTQKLSVNDATPGFTLHVGPALDIVFTRIDVSQVYTTGYTVSVPQISGVDATLYWGGNLFSHEQSVRTWGFDVIYNPDKSLTILNLGGHEGLTDYPQRKISIIVLRGAKSGYAGQDNYMYATPTPIFSLPLTLTDNSSITKCDRIPYTYDSTSMTTVQLIRSKSFLTTNSTDRALEIATAFDVSAVTANSLLTFGGKRYYALDSHTIMEV